MYEKEISFMEKENIIRKYFTLCGVFLVLLVLLWLTVCFTVQSSILRFISLLVLLLLVNPIKLIITKRTILSVLFNELDAHKFREIISDKRFVPPFWYRISGAISTGDYKTVVNMAATQIRKKNCSVRVKYACLSILARAYFELRDFEKLKVLYTKYEEYKKSYSSKSYFRKTNSMWSYYKYFSEQNYYACKTVCKERNMALKPKAWGSKYVKLQNDFYYAVACYSDGELETAKESFENIINTAPKMFLSKVSQKYLETIGTSSQPIVSEEEVLPQEDYRPFDVNTSNKIRRNRVVFVIMLSVLCILTVISSVSDYINQQNYNAKIAEFENDLNDALSDHYEQARFIRYFSTEYNGQYLDTLCIIDTTDGLDLASIVTYDGGETCDIIILKEDINIAKSYCIKSAVSDNYIGFRIFNSQISDGDFYYAIEFTYDDEKYWLGIDYIGETVIN